MSPREEQHVPHCNCDYEIEGDRWESHVSHQWDPRCKALNEERERQHEQRERALAARPTLAHVARVIHELADGRCACGEIALDGKECAECFYARIEYQLAGGGSRDGAPGPQGAGAARK